MMRILVSVCIIEGIFPFKDVNMDIQEYGGHIYYHMNSLILQIKEWLDKPQMKRPEESQKLQQRPIEEMSPLANSQENTESKVRVNCRTKCKVFKQNAQIPY